MDSRSALEHSLITNCLLKKPYQVHPHCYHQGISIIQLRKPISDGHPRDIAWQATGQSGSSVFNEREFFLTYNESDHN
jgi:hypothetical protein